jgi:N,N'-diacetylchitobiose non-reducing end deacetylase
MIPKNNLSMQDLFSAKRVLCIQPHYDDNDIYAGGTIALLHDLGAEIFYLTVTDDLVGVLDQSLTDEQMSAQLLAEQKEAGEIIGVKDHYGLRYPDAGEYNYYQLRKDIIGYIRLLRPDFVATVDPWLPYEVHRDHILTGQAASEAVFLVGFARLKSKPEIDQDYIPHEIRGIAYYNSASPNLVVDISQTTRRKRKAMNVYRGQFTVADLLTLEKETELSEREAAEGQNFNYAEKIKLVRPSQLHGNTDTWRS